MKSDTAVLMNNSPASVIDYASDKEIGLKRKTCRVPDAEGIFTVRKVISTNWNVITYFKLELYLKIEYLIANLVTIRNAINGKINYNSL